MKENAQPYTMPSNLHSPPHGVSYTWIQQNLRCCRKAWYKGLGSEFQPLRLTQSTSVEKDTFTAKLVLGALCDQQKENKGPALLELCVLAFHNQSCVQEGLHSHSPQGGTALRRSRGGLQVCPELQGTELTLTRGSTSAPPISTEPNIHK